jgi:hypothetical protein
MLLIVKLALEGANEEKWRFYHNEGDANVGHVLRRVSVHHKTEACHAEYQEAKVPEQ